MPRPRVPAALLHPVRVLPSAFLALSLLGTLLLLLPVSHHDDGSSPWLPALFTSVSAVTVTGLTTVDTATYWTPFGHVVLLVLVQVGGLGIMTLATLLGVLVGGRLGLRTRLMAQADLHVVTLGEVGPLLRRVAVAMVGVESVVALCLALRFRLGYDLGVGESLWHGVFHAVMAFNNAGFALESDNLVGFAGDALVIVPICVAVFLGAIGFPVLAELFQEWRTPRRWSIHTRLTVWGSLGLLVVGVLGFLVVEWRNPGTIGPTSLGHKLVTGVEGGVMPRSGGFNSIDWGQARPESLDLASALMFIGGGSASTAGGIKVTTFLLLGYVILAEVRGDEQVRVGRRAIGAATIRQALTIALLAVMLVAVSTVAITALTGYGLLDVLFECTSAFGTVGLSTGLTGSLGWAPQSVLMLLMLVGRVGTITAASAFTLRRRATRYRLPEERPIIG